MTVSAVGKNDNSCLNTVVKSTAIGTAAGYSLKYLWSVSKNELDVSDKRFVNLGRKIANESKIEEFAGLTKKSPAQDCFIKMVKEDKAAEKKTAFSFTNIKKQIKTLGGENSAAGKELKSIIRECDSASKEITRRIAGAYRVIMKQKRPCVPFLVAGAGAGFIAGITHNIIKNDV